MKYYEMAKDYHSLVRILCFNGEMARAAEIVEETSCKSAAYHLARRLGVENEVSEAVGLSLHPAEYTAYALSLHWNTSGIVLCITFVFIMCVEGVLIERLASCHVSPHVFLGSKEGHSLLYQGSVLFTGYPACQGKWT